MSPSRYAQALAVAQREFDTLVRTPASLVLVVLFGLGVLAVPLLGGAGGYLPLVLNLTTPVEVLVPTLAVGLGYRAIVADAERGELDVIRTYPIDRTTYVAGTFLGRATLLIVGVVTPLLAAAVVVPLTSQPTPWFLTAHATVDSPSYYARFVVLAAAYAVVALAIVVPVSAVARSHRRGIALAVTTVLVFVLGLDALLFAGVTEGVVSADTLGIALAASPASAFRGVALALAATPIQSVSFPAPPVLPGLASMLAWTVGSLTAAAVLVWRD